MKDNILSKLFIYFAIFICLLIAFVFLICNNYLLFFLAFSFCLFLSFNKKIKKFPLFLFILSFFIRLIAVIVLDLPQTTDFSILLDAASSFSLGDFSFQYTDYFSLWGYQTGFVIYEGIILKLFGNVFVLKFLNILYSSSLCIIIYYFARQLCNEKSAKLVSLLYMIFPFSIYLNTVLANHHIATFLTYIGIFFLLREERKISNYIIAGILISLGNIMRPEGIIVVVTLILYEIFRLKKDKVKVVMKHFAIFILVYLLIGMASSLIITKTGINSEGLNNNDTLWKFVLGLNYDSCGYYDEDDLIYLNDKEAELEVIKERILVGPLQLSQLMVCKIDNFWLQSDIATENETYLDKTVSIMGYDVKFVDLEELFMGFNSILYLFSLFACLFGIIYNYKYILKSKALFFVILMMVTFGVYLLIEIQPRYAYFIQVTIFILAAYGYSKLIDFISKRFKNN